MAFEPRIIEAKLALDLISSTDMPALGTLSKQVLMGLPLGEWPPSSFRRTLKSKRCSPKPRKKSRLDEGEAALRLAKARAKEILATKADPFKHFTSQN
jgi:hypothetical protein